MACRAFARRKMLALWCMAGEAQAPIRDEPRNRRLPMAGVARHVCIHRIRVGRPDVRTAVAAGAVAPRAVVVLVTRGAALHGCCRIQGDRGLVTRRTLDLRVCRVRKRDCPRTRRMIANRNGDSFGVRRRQLTGRMTGRAVARGRRLMVTNLTAARRHECEACVGAACDVTGEAGELLVAIVGERVSGGREPGAGSRGCAGRIRVALSSRFRLA